MRLRCVRVCELRVVELESCLFPSWRARGCGGSGDLFSLREPARLRLPFARVMLGCRGDADTCGGGGDDKRSPRDPRCADFVPVPLRLDVDRISDSRCFLIDRNF